MGRPPEPIEGRFWAKVNKNGTYQPSLESNCWEWTAGLDGKGYGMFSIRHKSIKAPRVSWELANGSIPHNLCILHKCDNPICVNPSHLFLGTLKDNMQDMLRKGRGNKPYGERSGNAKLTDAKVRKIKSLYKTGKYTQKEIASQFSVSRRAIGFVIKGETWKHVK